MSELKPCPFCGRTATMRDDMGHSTAVYFGCSSDLGCLGSDQWAETEEEAVAMWNTRVDFAADEIATLTERVAELEALIAGPTPDSISMHVMTDGHTFGRMEASTPEELVAGWREALKNDGELSLCPVILLHGKKEIRRVGKMLHANYETRKPNSEDAVSQFIHDLRADPDVCRIMALTKGMRSRSNGEMT